MQFLKTLLWVVAAVVLVLFARANWFPVTLSLWGEGDNKLVTDVKLPVLVVAAFLLGFIPTYIVYRTRVWALKRRLEGQATAHVANVPPTPVRNAPAAAAADEAEERRATDSKAWPAE